MNKNNLEDFKYFQDRVFSALGVPKEFLRGDLYLPPEGYAIDSEQKNNKIKAPRTVPFERK